ncbi:Crp/Fnr family transcriptional regulator [Bradyrhizobium sp. CCBAU 53338]|uniref:Crp/Fnr family transcriptional regulator n=1 Tax=Bradyrhizobium sp. CCBAU 53338 TaxID=1325111 RepID=UPI00352C8F18
MRIDQRAVFIFAANAASCLPFNGYMDNNTTITICSCRWQLDIEGVTPTFENQRPKNQHPGSRYPGNTQDCLCMSASGPPPNQMLQMLDAADFDLLRPHLVTIELVRETVLDEAGAALRHVLFPHDGTVSITVSLSEGQTIEVAMLGRDSIVGGGAALADGIAASDAVVLFPGTASAVEIPAFRTVANASIAFRSLIIRHEQALLARAQQSLLCNALHPVEARLARWLLRARDLSDRETLALTQETLAQMMGVRRNAVSLVAHELQRAGIISYSRGQIEIIDLRALEATSCECHAAVKAHHARLFASH